MLLSIAGAVGVAFRLDGSPVKTGDRVPVADLDYAEDSNAETDMNVVMNDAEAFIEVQGTAEGHAFRMDELNAMLDLARQGIAELFTAQEKALNR